MMYLRGCPRCKGDLQVNRDTYGSYRKCVQCGHIEDLDKKSQGLIPFNQVGKLQIQRQQKLG